MKGATRIYEVEAKDGKRFLVEGVSREAARSHVADRYVGDVSIPNGKRLAELMGAGTKVEMAGANPEPAATSGDGAGAQPQA